MDVHAASIRLAAISGDELLDECTLPFDCQLVERELRRFGVGRVCYEAGPTGFGLARYLRTAGFACDVIAPGLVSRRTSDRVKTDKRDACKLALLDQGGMLAPIWLPSAEQVAVCDLIRAREDARQDRARARQRLGKFILRHDQRLPGKGWTLTRRQWLGQQTFEHSAQQTAFDDYLLACDLLARRVETLKRQIDEWADHEASRELVAHFALPCAASTLSPPSNWSPRSATWLVSTARRLLIEAAHNQRRRPARSAHLARRQSAQPV